MYQFRGLRTEPTRDKWYLVASVLLTVLMCIAADSANPVFSVGIMILCLFFANRPEYLLPCTLVSSLMGDYFIAFTGVGMARLTVLMYIVFCLLHILISKRNVSKVGFLGLIGASVFCIASAMTSLTGEVTNAITLVLNFVMIFFMANTIVHERNTFLKSMKYNLWVFTIFLILTAITGRGKIYEGDRLMIGMVNPNGLGMCAAQVLVYLVSFAYLETDRKHIIIDLVMAAIAFYILGLTGSRSALIAVAVTVGVMLISKIGKKLQAKHAGILVLIIAGIWIGWELLRRYAPEMLNRFTVEDITEDGGTGRVEIWTAMLTKVIPDHLLLGVGYGAANTLIAMAPYVPRALGVHNMFITVLAQVGVVGMVLFCCFWYMCVKKGWNARKLDAYMTVPLYMLLAAFVNGVGEEIIPERYLWFSAGLIFLIIYNHKNGNWGADDENSLRS